MNSKPEKHEQALTLMREQSHLSDREIARRVGVGNKTVSRWRTGNADEQQPDDVLSSMDLCALLSEHGVQMTERRLRGWRRAGYLVPLYRKWSGRESTFVWPRQAVEQGIETDRLLRRYRDRDQTIVGLFSRGFAVDGDKLKAAYGKILAHKADDLDGVRKSFKGIYDNPGDESWNHFAEYVLSRYAQSRTYKGLRRMRRVEERKLPRDEQSSPAAYVEATVLR